jgi:broad specificity phosphatase PhoE
MRRKMPFVHMIRHAKPASIWGDAAGDQDPGLDAEGKAQAKTVAVALLALPPAARPVRVVSSPLRRCRETAEPLADALGLPIEIEPAVAEIPTPKVLANAARGDWLRRSFQGRWDEIVGDLDYAQWARGVARAVVSQPGAAVFSHFVAINAAVSVAKGDPRVRQFEPAHTAVTRFEIVGEGLYLIEAGCSSATQVL